MRARDYAVIGVLAAVVRLVGASLQSLWYDETFTAQIVSGSLRGVWGSVRATETTPVLSYYLGWIPAHVFGTSDVALRVVAIVASACAAMVVSAATARCAGRRAALAAGALAALNPFSVWFGQEARAYAVMELCAAGLVYSLIVWRRRPARGAMWWSIAATCMIVTHYAGWVMVLATLVGALVFRGPAVRLLVCIAALVPPAVAVALTLPMLRYQAAQGRAEWIGDSSLVRRGLQATREFVTGVQVPHQLLVGALAWVVLTMLIVGALRSSRDARILLLVMGVGLATTVAGALAGVDVVLARNLIWMLPPIIVIAGIGYASTRPLIGNLTLGVLLVMWGGAALVASMSPDYMRPDWHRAIASLPASVDEVIVDPPMQRELVRWYAPTLQVQSLAPDQVGGMGADARVLGGNIIPEGMVWHAPPVLRTVPCRVTYQRAQVSVFRCDDASLG